MEDFSKSGRVTGKMLQCPSDALSVVFACAVWAWYRPSVKYRPDKGLWHVHILQEEQSDVRPFLTG